MNPHGPSKSPCTMHRITSNESTRIILYQLATWGLVLHFSTVSVAEDHRETWRVCTERRKSRSLFSLARKPHRKHFDYLGLPWWDVLPSVLDHQIFHHDCLLPTLFMRESLLVNSEESINKHVCSLWKDLERHERVIVDLWVSRDPGGRNTKGWTKDLSHST